MKSIIKHPALSCPWFFTTVKTLFFLPVLFLMFACSKQPEEKPPASPVPVSVARVTQKNVPVDVRAIGNVEAYSTVLIKTQVNGELRHAHFTEGGEVKKGSLLFTIDPRPFEAALKEAEANLARDVATAEKARHDARRYAKLYKEEVVSREQFEQFRSNAESLDAVVQADRAAIENAKVNLGYCTIRSPLSGFTGSLLVHEGNVVKENETILVVINQVSPIYVNFSVPEQYLKDIEENRRKNPLTFIAVSPGGKNSSEGILTFVDNTVDTTTGTIRLKGTFENQEKYLWPGQFVNVVLTLYTQLNALTIPSQAVQVGQQGEYVFVVTPNRTVESRPVIVSRRIDGETVVEKGLKAGETVVTDGQLRLVPGSPVNVKQIPGGKAKHS
jgi:membrane fusion protein, multidrug efflux system